MQPITMPKAPISPSESLNSLETKLSEIACQHLKKIAQESHLVKSTFLQECQDKIVQISQLIAQRLAEGRKLLIFGNGGSAADSQHFAAELVGQLLIKNRKPMAAIALTTDSSNLTSIGNDFGFDMIYERQIRALGKPRDIAFGISTSGNSPNVYKALEAAQEQQMTCIGLTGGSGGKLSQVCHFLLNARAGENSCRIQETHIFAIHAIVDLIESIFSIPTQEARLSE